MYMCRQVSQSQSNKCLRDFFIGMKCNVSIETNIFRAMTRRKNNIII